jgi:uncharacterized protein (DUF2249 family)
MLPGAPRPSSEMAMHIVGLAGRNVAMLAPAAPSAPALDLRDIRLRDGPTRVLAAFRGLAAEQILHLASDQSLEWIYFEFLVATSQAFHWEYLETGPVAWRADVTRPKAYPDDAGCLGSSGDPARRPGALE